MTEEELEEERKKFNEEIPLEDSTPTISEQAKSNGWQADYYNFGKAESLGYDWFNPSLVERPDGVFLIARGSQPHPHLSFGQNNLWAFEMEENMITPKVGTRLKWPVDDPNQHFEDARGFYHPTINQTVISACTFCWYMTQPWSGAHQVIGTFDHEWKCQTMRYPKIGGNPGKMERIENRDNYEKNWLFFLHENQLHLLYRSKPWSMYAFGDIWTDITYFKHESGVQWRWGDIRGGTPPVRVGDYYFTFHHSSLHWKGRWRRYYAGCIAFEAKPPFYPKMITPDPLLTGSQNDIWRQHKPLVVFPCGAIYKNGEWMISMGINDLRAAWLKLPHKDVMERMRGIDESAPVFQASGLSEGEQQKQLMNGGDAIATTGNRERPVQSEVVVKPHRRSTRKKRRKYKMSPEGLANLRANAAKAREARKKKILQKV